MASKIQYEAKDVKELTKWLKRFSSIEKSVLLELDDSKSIITGKTHNEERSVVKKSSINLTDCGLNSTSKSTNKIKLGIYSLPQLIKILDHFNDSNFTLTVNYDEMIDTESNKELVMTSIILKNSNLKMTLEGAPLSMFNYISDEKFNNNIALLTEKYPEVEFNIHSLDEINTLASMDGDYKFIDLVIKDGKFIISGKVYNKLISVSDSEDDFSISIYKDQYEKLDKEDYNLVLAGDRLVCKSKNSNTVMVMSGVDKSDIELNKPEEDSPF